MNTNECHICNWISKIEGEEKPYFVMEMDTGYVFLSNNQYFKGYTYFLSKMHVNELHFLPPEIRLKFLNEMCMVSEAVYNTFKPIKINCESLGNLESHIHWHIIPRYGTDPFPTKPIWKIDDKIITKDEYKPSVDELREMKENLLTELINVINNTN